MSPNPTPTSPDQIHELVDTIERAIQSGADLVNGIINRVVDFLDWLPGFISNRVLPWLRRLADAVQGFFAKVLELLEGVAFPVFAFVKANSWNDEVRNPVTKVAGELSDGALHVGDYWQGPASIAYTNALTAQTKAYTEVGTIVDDLKIRLWATAGLIVGFYVALAAIIIQWIGVMTASAAATATGLGRSPVSRLRLPTPVSASRLCSRWWLPPPRSPPPSSRASPGSTTGSIRAPPSPPVPGRSRHRPARPSPTAASPTPTARPIGNYVAEPAGRLE